MRNTMLAIVIMIVLLGGCSQPMQSTQMTDEQRCAISGGTWRANSLCEQPSGPHTGRR